MPRFSKQVGVTLVELIIAIVIISIAVVAILQSLGQQTLRNVDPMLQSQAQLLAKQFLDEVKSKSFFDPSADPRLVPNLTAAQLITSIADQAQRNADATNRLTWNNLYEYHSYNDSEVRNADGTAIPELSGYSVTISVDISEGLSMGSAPNALINIASCPATLALITVTVTDPRGQQTSLQGYRTRYWDATSYGLVGC